MKALSKQTRSIKPAEVEKKWHLIDADGLVVGRLAVIGMSIDTRPRTEPSSCADGSTSIITASPTTATSSSTELRALEIMGTLHSTIDMVQRCSLCC